MEAIRTKSARHKFTAARDENGVPHVEAATWNEALYAWGYMHAIDRPTQVYFARAIASGQATERIANKPELLEMDIFLRRAGLYRDLEREFRRLPERTREQLDWYCQGVNDGLVDAGRTLPMWVTGFRPRPWEPTSVLLIGKLLSFAGLTIGEQENERLLLELIQLGVDDERLRELFHSLSGRHRLRAAPRDSHRQATVGRNAGIARRFAAPGRQQRLGRKPGAQRDRPRDAGVRSASGSESPAADLVRDRAPLGRRRIRDGRHAARLPDHGGRPHAAACPGASRTCTPTRAIFSSKIAGPAARRVGNIGAATAGSIFSGARK